MKAEELNYVLAIGTIEPRSCDGRASIKEIGVTIAHPKSIQWGIAFEVRAQPDGDRIVFGHSGYKELRSTM